MAETRVGQTFCDHTDRQFEATADLRLKQMMEVDKPIFDYKRMVYGGFRELGTRDAKHRASDLVKTPRCPAGSPGAK